MTDQAPAAPDGAADVCLVTMPYSSLSRPSMALGLLKALLAEGGITTEVAHANLWFAEQVGLRQYELCSTQAPTVFLMGEWTFAAAAFGDDPRRKERDLAYLREIADACAGQSLVLRGADKQGILGSLEQLRKAANRFIDETAERVLATGARIVGCTSTFEQHVASLALLRRVRELDPGVITMLGGANCETVMGEATHRCFPWVDYVASGEADGLIVELCRLALAKGRDVPIEELPRGVRGPAHRDGAGARPGARPGLPRATFNDLGSLPTPKFDDYFRTLAASPLREDIRPGLPVETSRGCWWGAAHQCTFCGLNGTGLGYRSKPAQRVVDELNELQDTYGIGDFETVDNILDNRHYKTLLPLLAADDRQRRIFYEIKANVSKAHIESLVAAGVTWVQPGIESLHTEVLRLMDKGIQGWQNIQLLKWSRELGLRLSWALLWGFPGEKDDWYEDMAGWLPALEHLQPPANAPRIRFDRYSVYHEQAQQMGLILFPIGAMSLIYPVEPADLDQLTYFFATEPNAGPRRTVQALSEEMAGRSGARALVDAVQAWSRVYRAGRRPQLWLRDRVHALIVTDTRSCATLPRHVLTGLARAVYLACDAAPRQAGLAEVVARDFGLTATEDELAAVVRRLVTERLVLQVDDRLVGLALHKPSPPYPDYTKFPGGYVTTRQEPATVEAEPK